MALVRVRANGLEFNAGTAHAVANQLTVLADESAYKLDGTPREVTREGGRPRKPVHQLPPSAPPSQPETSTDPTNSEEE